jgi:hypothetical protein
MEITIQKVTVCSHTRGRRVADFKRDKIQIFISRNAVFFRDAEFGTGEQWVIDNLGITPERVECQSCKQWSGVGQASLEG